MTWAEYLDDFKSSCLYRRVGKVNKVTELSIEASGIDVSLGDICLIKPKNQARNTLLAKVVSQDEESTILMPLGDTHGVGVGADIELLDGPLKIKVGDALLGHVIDPLGESMQHNLSFTVNEQVTVEGESTNPLDRQPVSHYLTTGVRTIDALMPIGMGQRIGIFSGSGVGKSTLLGMIAKNSFADINVIALIGERGREVNDFVNKVLNETSLAKSIIIVATADQPTLIRELAANTATAIAEHFSNQKKNVMLIMDSVTRYAMAKREIGLSIGEPATARGYTPSTFAALPKLLERAGNFKDKGSITGVYTVLVEGDDLNEPVSDHMRAILDGHIVLSRDLANKGHFPAIDVLKSISRVANDLWTDEEKSLVKSVLRLLDIRESYKDIVEIGAYKQGANIELDKALEIYPKLYEFLVQDDDALVDRETLFARLDHIMCASV